MKSAFLAALLAVPSWAAAPKPAAPAKAAGSPDEKLVDYFLKTDTGELNPTLIPHFMELDLTKLPERQRAGVRSKRLELNSLRRVSESGKKPPIRRAGQEPLKSCGVEEGTAQLASTMKGMGFMEITDDEEHFLQDKTKCTECELSEEFTLTRVIVEADKAKKKPAEKFLFIHSKDPLAALVSQYRDGHNGGTNFFGVGFFGACR